MDRLRHPWTLLPPVFTYTSLDQLNSHLPRRLAIGLVTEAQRTLGAIAEQTAPFLYHFSIIASKTASLGLSRPSAWS